jgi:DNA-binding NarL/FixJ family response regulator
VLNAIQAGAGGYLLKDSDDAAIIAAIEQLLQGGAPLSPSIAVHLMRRLQAPAPAPAGPVRPPVELSAREQELLRLIAKGLSYEEVAGLTGLRYNTIASYAKELYRKLQVHGRAEAAFEAVQMGLVGGSRDPQ